MLPIDRVQAPDARGQGGWVWDQASDTYLWTDGNRYTWRARWNGSSWVQEPLVAESATGRTRRARGWRLGSLIVIGIGLGGLGLYGFHEACCTHDLLEDDFESGEGHFQTGEVPDYVADRHRGTYRITSRTDSPDTPALSFAWMARQAGAVRAEVTIVDPGAGVVGVACVLPGDTGSRLPHGYAFVVGDGNASLIELGEDAPIRSARSAPVRPDQRIGVQCGFGKLEGIIDGVDVLSASYRRGPHMFDRVVLYFDPAAKDDAVRFDDVDAHLPD